LSAAGLDELHERIAGRSPVRAAARVREYVSGLSRAWNEERLDAAEWAGEVSPDGCSGCCGRADWDVDGVADDVRAYVVEQLGDPAGY